MAEEQHEIKQKLSSKLSKHKRTNDENSDAYKIFSILYGLVLFIAGVAFSISHAIIPIEDAENIKYLTEIYFTYLYWISILWIIFCIIDIIRHRNKVKLNQATVLKTKIDSNDMMVNKSANFRLLLNRNTSELLNNNEQTEKIPSTPYFNLQLFDDSDECRSDEKENHSNKRRPDIYLSKSSDDEDCSYMLNNKNTISSEIQYKSHSFSIPPPSSLIMKRQGNSTRDFSTRRDALDPGAVNHLKSFIRHRKHSIVQHVIGYNYDDHSTAGGLYTRVGIGIFCLGTVIHSGLSILSNLENLSCTRWTAVIEDSSRLLFSFVQFFFIFKNSNLLIRAHESLARLAVMHIVVTNLCVWFRMVVIETRSQITEIGTHEMVIAQVASGRFFMNGSQILIQQQHFSSINLHNCWQSIKGTHELTTFVYQGYVKLKPLLYPCTIEFSLMCLTLFFLIWENIGKTFPYKISDKASTKNVFMVNCHSSIKGLFAGMIVFSCTIISVILYAVFRNKTDDDHNLHSLSNHQMNSYRNHVHSRDILLNETSTLSNLQHIVNDTTTTEVRSSIFHSETPITIIYGIAVVEIATLCLLSTSLLATTWTLFKIRNLQYKRTTTRFDDVLIIVSLTGTYLYTIFSAFALVYNKNKSTWIAYLKIVIVVLEFVEATVHAFFILVALRKRLSRTTKQSYPAREIITLLIILDLSLWFEETTTTTKYEANPFQLAFYHVIPWSIIAAIATPLQIFFRFHASVCLSHVWENMYILPDSDPIVSHSF